MLTIQPADAAGLRWAQAQVIAHHYLHTPVDVRCCPFAYLVQLGDVPVGCLIFGRPESTRCYQGRLTYGSFEEQLAGRVAFDRWELLNMARVWMDPRIQQGGANEVPHAASTAIHAALARVGFDYLVARPPVDCARPYQIRVVLSYCDTRIHTGYLYRVCRFKRARTNAAGVQTFMKHIPALTDAQDAVIRHLAETNARSQAIRQARTQPARDLRKLEEWNTGKPIGGRPL